MWRANMVRYMAHEGTPGILTCKNAALETPLVADPGDAWEYGIGIDWAVEAASGQRLANTCYWIDPKRGVAGVLMTQILPFADARVLALLDQFEQAVYADATHARAA